MRLLWIVIVVFISEIMLFGLVVGVCVGSWVTFAKELGVDTFGVSCAKIQVSKRVNLENKLEMDL
jgi:hypothetical protein